MTDYDVVQISQWGSKRPHRVNLVPTREVTEHRLRRLIDELCGMYHTLSEELPKPVSHQAGRRGPSSPTSGHPAEWASDAAAQIADMLWSWSDLIAEMRSETRPRPAVDPRSGRRLWLEADVVRKAYRYLTPRWGDVLARGSWDEFSKLPTPWARHWTWVVEDEAFDELFDLSRRIRSGLGATRPREVLPLPCPSSECGLLTLERHAGMAGREFIVCGACGYAVDEAQYPFLVRLMVDTLSAEEVAKL